MGAVFPFGVSGGDKVQVIEAICTSQTTLSFAGLKFTPKYGYVLVSHDYYTWSYQYPVVSVFLDFSTPANNILYYVDSGLILGSSSAFTATISNDTLTLSQTGGRWVFDNAGTGKYKIVLIG
jgi:hypothetical protein